MVKKVKKELAREGKKSIVATVTGATKPGKRGKVPHKENELQ